MSQPNETQLMSIEEPFPGDPPPAEPAQDDDEAIPEGAQIVNGQPVISPSVLAAERKRAREKAKEDAEKEFAPIRAKAAEADALRQALDTVKPHLEQLRQQAQRPPEAPQEPQVSDAEAEQEARDLQLYTKDSTLDVATARKIITRRRAEAKAAAVEAAKEAVTPYAQTSARDLSARNFEKFARDLVGDDGQLMADPQIVVDTWKTLPPDLTQHEEVARIAMAAALGESLLRKRKSGTRPPAREPIVSEAPGGRTSSDIRVSESGKKMGLTDADLKASAKTYKPGEPSEIGSW